SGAVGRLDGLEARHVELGLLGGGRDPRGRTDEDRLDEALLRRLDGASKRSVVTGMRNGRGYRLQLTRLRDQALVMAVRRDCVHRGAPDNSPLPARRNQIEYLGRIGGNRLHNRASVGTRFG